MNGRVLSEGESMDFLRPHDDDDNPIKFGRTNELWRQTNNDRGRVTVEICYRCTLGECWILRGGGLTPSTTTEPSRCPMPSAIKFQR